MHGDSRSLIVWLRRPQRRAALRHRGPLGATGVRCMKGIYCCGISVNEVRSYSSCLTLTSRSRCCGVRCTHTGGKSGRNGRSSVATTVSQQRCLHLIPYVGWSRDMSLVLLTFSSPLLRNAHHPKCSVQQHKYLNEHTVRKRKLAVVSTDAAPIQHEMNCETHNETCSPQLVRTLRSAHICVWI